MGIMVGGGAPFIASVRRFLEALGIGGTWSWALDRFTSVIQPDTYLFKVDRDGAAVAAGTLYLPISAAAVFRRSASTPRQLRTALVDRAVDRRSEPRPRGGGPARHGLSLDRLGRMRLCRLLSGAVLVQNIQNAASWPRVRVVWLQRRRGRLDRDRGGPVLRARSDGVIGIEAAAGSTSCTLKLDPANVPLRQVKEALELWDVPDGYVGHLEQVAGALRAASASYVGLKFTAIGFSGWKLYFAVRPSDVTPAGAPRVVGPRELSPSLRSPHY